MHLNLIKPIQRLVVSMMTMTLLISCVTPSEKLTTNSENVYLQLGARYLAMNKLSLAKENLEKALDADSSSANNVIELQDSDTILLDLVCRRILSRARHSSA